MFMNQVFWLVFGLLILLTRQREECEPFGVRIFLGQVFKNQSSSERLAIMFNTDRPCEKSYVQIQYNKSSLQKVYCHVDTLSLTLPSNSTKPTYTTTIHKCSFDKIEFAAEFQYNVYGWNGDKTSIPKPYRTNNIVTSIFDPQDTSKELKFMFLADWGVLYSKKGYYTPLDASFQKILSSEKIDAMIVGGDLGYDLDSNECKNYEDYLNMISQVSIYWPTISTTGNHEYNTENNYKLFVRSFVMYNLDTQLADSINLGNFYLVDFDPYYYLYDTLNLRHQQHEDALQKFQSEIRQTARLPKPIVAHSHYPLMCSGDSKFCKSDTKMLKGFFDALFVNNVGFYVGSHFHTYERIYPYFQNKTTSPIKPPYSPQANKYLLSIVEGCAGNQVKIIQQYAQIHQFTASYTANETGYGILTSHASHFKYEHFSAKRGTQVTDSMEFVLYPSLPGNSLQQQ